ncbi:hypothetical protein KCU81_g5458, partial [Aureobasidium melanogenum]|uniref:Uncharacterized protein n=1 Tax=Aureobasidium melanogenum (strain CBS 110374) TaxID=1043003 RepID=A0A074WTE3_AURM1
MLATQLILALVLASSQHALAKSCSQFEVINRFNDSTYTATDGSRVISKGANCPPTDGCSVPYGGYVTTGRTLNISDPSYADSVYKTISSAVDLEFVEAKTYPVSNGTEKFENGASGYVIFTPYTICTTGTLSSCDADGLYGEIVEACTPDLRDGKITGDIGPVISVGGGLEKLTCNPSNTTQAKNGNYSASCTGSDAEADHTGTANPLGGVSLLLLSGSLLVAFIGF